MEIWPTNFILCVYLKVCENGWPDDGLNVRDGVHYTNILSDIIRYVVNYTQDNRNI
jgi:hypothetical protein